MPICRSFILGASAVALATTMTAQTPATPPAVAPPAPRSWTMAELLPQVADLGTDRDWKRGGQVFEQAGCGLCHAMNTYWEGNGLAPDLTSVASRFTRDVILQSILEPSATLNGQYYHTEFTLKDGTMVRGSVVGAAGDRLLIAPVMLVPDVTIDIARSDIVSEAPSRVSPMPAGLVDPFTREQVLDLLAFLDAGGNADASVYRK